MERVKIIEHLWLGDYHELPFCIFCGSFEGATTTECPGESYWGQVHGDTSASDAVYHGYIDFRNGKWCNQPAAGMKHVYGTSREPYVEYESLEEALKCIPSRSEPSRVDWSSLRSSS